MASSSLKPLQGMSDLRAPEIVRWQSVEDTARRVMALYGYTEIRTPVLERAAFVDVEEIRDGYARIMADMGDRRFAAE